MTETANSITSSTPNPGEKLTEEKQEQYAAILRGLSEHENNLLDSRVKWLTTIQGLLFAGLGFFWKEGTRPFVNLFPIVLIAIMGILVAVSTISAVQLWRAALKNLRAEWLRILKDYKGPPRVGMEGTNKMTFFRLFRPWRILPWAFIIAWLVILLYA